MKLGASFSSSLFAFVLLVTTHVGRAELIVPSANGTDGALNITANTVIDLSLAPTGTWD